MDPKDLKYTRTNEWCHIDGDVVTIGVTEAAAKKLHPIVYVELPDNGDDVLSDEPFGEIESFKSVMPLHSPVDGAVIEVNTKLLDNPDPIVNDPFGKGWLVKIKAESTKQLEDLISYDEHKQLAKKT
ncbi:MAG TPA: glycine cleavage system protein GcvH [Candidatus Brocadiia bacterium]|nr:glycine cleavage system protein GcvH [Candidatus Brocadiia bacterium]